MKKDIFVQLRDKLKTCGKTQTEIARVADVQQGSLSRFMKGTQPTLNGETFVRLVSFLGGDIFFPDGAIQSPERDICFVTPKTVSVEDSTALPHAEDYIAVPLVGEVGAGPGYLPENIIERWFIVYRYQSAVRYRRNLIAVEIGADSVSMQPTLNPGDIVLIDRDDRDVSIPGRIMLVLDPLDGSGMIKRVAVTQMAVNDFQITYYSDNASHFPPNVYSLQHDFAGDWEHAIVGRAVWAWSDVRNK